MPQLLLAIFFIRNLYYLDYLKKERLEELTIFVEELFLYWMKKFWTKTFTQVYSRKISIYSRRQTLL